MLRFLRIPVVLLAASPAAGQVTLIDWIGPTGASYSDSASWAGGVVPDGALHGPRFSHTGFRTVGLTNDFARSVGAIRVELPSGSGVIWKPEDSTQDATLVAEGQLLHAGGQLRLDRDSLGVETHVTTASTVVTGGAELRVTNHSSLTSQATSVQAGEGGTTTSLVLKSSSEASLGEVAVGVTGSGGAVAEIVLEGDSQVMANNVLVATGSPAEQRGELTIADSVFTQGENSSMTLGQANTNGGALVALLAGAELTTGAGGTSIFPSGRLLNRDSHANLMGDLLVHGGRYEEQGSATRTLAAGLTIEATNGAEVSFASSTLSLTDSQTLKIEEGATVTLSGNLQLGESSLISLEYNSTPPVEPLLQLGDEQQAELNGGIALRVADPSGFVVGDSFPLISAPAFAGTPVLSKAPATPPLLAWRLETHSETLWATLISQSMPGDYNGDRVVDAADYSVWRDTLGSDSELSADGDGDGRVDADDYTLWRENYGQSTPAGPSGSSQAPAPRAALLGFMSAILAYFQRRMAIG